jgi:predicted dehydrogenase
MTTRRSFIHKSGAIAGAAMVSPFAIHDLNGGVSQNDKITVALIGCKGMGWYNLTDHLKSPDVECAALCDVDESILNEKSAELEKLTGKKPKLYKDYRRVLEDKSIDAVIIGTPDHWHCLMAVHACEAGKDVYVEKPLANSIAECEVMLKAARKHSRIVQVGQQQRSGQHWQDIVGIVQSGKLGTIRKIKTWAYFAYGSAQPKVPDTPVPAGVDYDMWLGPAPKHPFNKNRFHGSWRFYWEQGGGLLTDWGVHLLDVPLWAMGVSVPKSVSSAGGIYAYPNNAIETADTQSVIYDFGNFLLEWDHAGGVSRGQYGRNYGVAFIGNNGTLVVNREGWEIIPELDDKTPRMEVMPLQPADRTDHEKHVRNFLDCVKSRKMPVCDVEFGRNSAVLAHMGNISYRSGNKIWWDDIKKNFGADDKANAFIQPAYRQPWRFPVA